MNYAPIIIFAFNRLRPLQNLIASLLKNHEVDKSDLYIFVDGAREGKDGEKEKVLDVQEYVKSIHGFKTISYRFATANKGLGPSIIEGVTELISRFGRVIVLEDDLIVAPGFLNYMNTMLEAYENDKRIMQVSGFSTAFSLPKEYSYDVYLNRRGESWSWGTWLDRWTSIDWEVKDFDLIKNSKKLQQSFNDIGSDMYGMLVNAVENRKTWAVVFCYNMFKQGAYQVSPIRSLVRNDGFNEESTNCTGYNRYKYLFNDTQLKFSAPAILPYDRKIDKAANRYWTISYRIWGKILTLYYKFMKR